MKGKQMEIGDYFTSFPHTPTIPYLLKNSARGNAGAGCDHELHIGFHYALAGQAGIDARVLGPVNEVLFLVGDFGQVVAARLM